MRPIFARLLVLLLLLSASSAWPLDAKDVAGNYELTGVMEMAGGLILKPDGTYRAGFSYGAADWEEEGNWKLTSNEVLLSGSRFKMRNPMVDLLFLPAGTKFTYKDGKLTGTDPSRKLTYLNPEKTPSPANKTPDSAGEGRMRVKGTVVQLDSQVLVVKMEECLQFDVRGLSEAVLKTAKQNLGKKIDVEIPYSAILGGGSCP